MRVELVASRAGRAGGYRLARPPATISILEIVEALEGPVTEGDCALRGGQCHWEQVCALHPVWSASQEAFRTTLESAALSDILEADRAIEHGTYDVPPDSHRLRGAG